MSTSVPIEFPPEPKRTWWQRLLRYETMTGDGLCPVYLHRWTLLTAFGCGLYLHKFTGDDWSLALHDHPKRFVSLGLWGQYVEHTPDKPPRTYRAPWIRTFPATHIHRITGPTSERPCWTLVAVFWRQREWGFWWDEYDVTLGRKERRWFPWMSFLVGHAKNSKSCP